MMAIIGFLLYDLSLPGSEILGLVLDCIAIIIAVAVVVVMNRLSSNRVLSDQSTG
jgi:hypothetical protein